MDRVDDLTLSLCTVITWAFLSVYPIRGTDRSIAKLRNAAKALLDSTCCFCIPWEITPQFHYTIILALGTGTSLLRFIVMRKTTVCWHNFNYKPGDMSLMHQRQDEGQN